MVQYPQPWWVSGGICTPRWAVAEGIYAFEIEEEEARRFERTGIAIDMYVHSVHT